MDDEGLEHLIRVVGLCQTPRDSWSEEDNRALREARKYVQSNRKEPSESTSAKADSRDPREGSQKQEGQASEGKVSEEGLPVEEGAEGTHGSED